MWAVEILVGAMGTMDGLLEYAGLLMLILWYMTYLDENVGPLALRVRGYFEFEHWD